MVIRTREKLIDVARQLFALKGIENTTMNDIATASDKGRRTIYTYFRNKREIYNAVIERESEQLVSKLRTLLDDPSLSTVDKLRRGLAIRMDVASHSIGRPDPIRSLFSREFKRLERVRRLASAKEMEILDEILARGVREGVFNAEQGKRLPEMLRLIMQGNDLLFLSEHANGNGARSALIHAHTIDFIINGLTTQTPTQI